MNMKETLIRKCFRDANIPTYEYISFFSFLKAVNSYDEFLKNIKMDNLEKAKSYFPNTILCYINVLTYMGWENTESKARFWGFIHDLNILRIKTLYGEDIQDTCEIKPIVGYNQSDANKNRFYHVSRLWTIIKKRIPIEKHLGIKYFMGVMEEMIFKEDNFCK